MLNAALHDFYVDEERLICDEIRAWSAYALEKPNPFFNNLPACPYAKKSWSENRVAIIFKYGGNQALYSTLEGFTDAFDLVVIVDRNYADDSEGFHDYLEQVNEAISAGIFGQKDLWVMGFHPEDEANELVDDGTFVSPVETPYAMIFVQRLSKVQEAADKLKELGYYDQYLEEYDAAETFERRERIYRRLKNGDESS